MQIEPTSVFRKTDRGTEELKTRRRALPPRLRQLLILVDGQRSVDEISRAIPHPELDAQLAQLEQGGFVCRSAVAGSEAAAAGNAGVAARPREAADARGAARAPATAASGTAATAADLPSLRVRVTQALLEAVGPNGEHLAMRLERAVSIEELRALLPSVLSVVEAVGGRRGVDLFLQRCGAI